MSNHLDSNDHKKARNSHFNNTGVSHGVRGVFYVCLGWICRIVVSECLCISLCVFVCACACMCAFPHMMPFCLFHDQVWPERVHVVHCQTCRGATPSMRNHQGKSLCWVWSQRHCDRVCLYRHICSEIHEEHTPESFVVCLFFLLPFFVLTLYYWNHGHSCSCC